MNTRLVMLVSAALAAVPAWADEDKPANLGAPPPAKAPATPAASPAEAEAAAPAPAGSVARAQFTREVREREPADQVTALPNTDTRIYFFTELKGMAGQTVTHRWEHNGKIMAEIPVEVGGERWRTYTSKTLDPSLTGEWKASVIDSAGGTLAAGTFTYNAPVAATATTR
jgi:hypothetical protein